ncbi:hypothetical protein PoHVEF18_002842 [Penicillium ochrochloron]
MRRVSFATLFGADPTYDTLHRFETSWLLPPTILAALRGLIALYIFTTIFFIWGWDGTHNNTAAIGQSFSYFTWLTYWGLGFYHLFAAIHTACYARTGRSVLFEKWPRACRISQHGLNSLYALLEIILPATAPHPWMTIPVLILLLAFYLCVAYITVHTEGFYTYSFLNPAANGSGLVAGYCFGILAAIIVIFLISWSLIRLRVFLTGDKRKRAARDPLRGQDGYSGVEMGLREVKP